MNQAFPQKGYEVLNTTGPIMLTRLYNEYDKKDDVYIIPKEIASPFSKTDIEMYLKGGEGVVDYLEKKLEKAIAVHYFVGAW